MSRKILAEDVEGEYESGEELLAFLKDQNPTLHSFYNEEDGSTTMYGQRDIIDSMETGEWITVHDPVDTVDNR